MMKFVLKQVKNGCRLGQLVDLPKEVAEKSLETPMCMLYTRAGSVPYMGRDVLDRIDKLPGAVNMPIPLLVENMDAMAEFPGGIKKFAAMDDFMTYCSIQDPAVLTPSGYNTKKAVSVWSCHGKYELDIPGYIKLMSSLDVDWVQSLSDGDTDRNTSEKRVIKSVERTINYLDELLEEKEKHEKLHSTKLIGTIVGGYLEEKRFHSARETAKRPVAGFSMEGFHNFGPESETFDLEDVKHLLSKTLELLPQDKPRILPGLMSPANLLFAVELGFDILDTSYPLFYRQMKICSALCYDYNLPPTSTDNILRDSDEQSLGWEMDLYDERYREDTAPVVKSCTCYTCTHHTRAYINHLLKVSELLAKLLLNVHNLHHYLRTFEVIRRAIADDTFKHLKQHIINQKPS
ncbi:hypothetical protein LSH36_59g00015 [Paralvinella palmiformis]|uniref:Queuine tRNA-ribosyltransferase accessory subunit 2 n=1 Tax=Paralvinella palmiformis TaxID=53620 RepID=A0AAD9NDN3_9ANNE|nr:hypothetical protein LSH36_59g00015 [Paralvinella palmiformis]